MTPRPTLFAADPRRILFDEDAELLLSSELDVLGDLSIYVNRAVGKAISLAVYTGPVADVADALAEASYLPVRRLLLEAP